MKKILAIIMAILTLGGAFPAYANETDTEIDAIVEDGETFYSLEDLLAQTGAEATWITRDENFVEAEVDYKGIVWRIYAESNGSMDAHIEGAGRYGNDQYLRLETDSKSVKCIVAGKDAYVCLESASWLMFSFGYLLDVSGDSAALSEVLPEITDGYRKIIEENEREKAEYMEKIRLDSEKAKTICKEIFKNTKACSKKQKISSLSLKKNMAKK